jgi:3'-5' exonuclease
MQMPWNPHMMNMLQPSGWLPQPTRKVAQLLQYLELDHANQQSSTEFEALMTRIMIPGNVTGPLEIMHDYLTFTGDIRGARLAELMIHHCEQNKMNSVAAAISYQPEARIQQRIPVPEEDDWALDKLDIEIITRDQLNQMPLSKEFTEGYLRLSEIKGDFEYEYHNCWNEQVQNFFKYLSTQKMVGIDTEFHLRTSKATYLQLATAEKGMILNIRNYRFRDQEEFKYAIKELFENKQILKVGLNLSCDTRVLKQAFFGEIDFEGGYSLDKELFTIATNGIALSTLCLRVFGKPLNKDCQAWIGEQEDLEDDDQKEYAIMDALTPILLFNKLEKALESQLDRKEFYVNCQPRSEMDLTEIYLDQPLDLMRQFLDQVKIRYEFIRDYTYDSKLAPKF